MIKYLQRNECIFCSNTILTKILAKNLSIPLGCYTIEETNKCYLMPYNILKCEKCNTYQTEYIGDRNIIYNYIVKPYGTIRSSMYIKFAKFILNNQNIYKITEFGAGDGELSDIILENKDIEYNIIDPSYSGNVSNRNIINDYIENIDYISGDTLIMSHIFEHLYEIF